ncbi:hypothetical protein P7D22_11280 [Lichenihabitans sp. Uapishka_5]|uniref:hypothetical protein n=1 Tax=Lichenihabitans sp. Uapishka_5 TaxID=3037302 RepID=UPI0029E7EC50|nr:hypothetical protein [Lichenihabitans sp. Uapishka_5]MDX7951750.1 hypothetical protein [Lichenihabitans sp. Uapishka_5]
MIRLLEHPADEVAGVLRHHKNADHIRERVPNGLETAPVGRIGAAPRRRIDPRLRKRVRFDREAFEELNGFQVGPAWSVAADVPAARRAALQVMRQLAAKDGKALHGPHENNDNGAAESS